MNEKRWLHIPVNNPALAENLSQSLNISKDLAEILVNRGLDSYESARRFFNPQLSDLYDPFLMLGMEKAVSRIETALQKNEKILIYGDYDVDGTSAVALVYSFLCNFTNLIDYYIPDRYIEGYGISVQGIEYADENNFSLIIALDCGIKAIDKVNLAAEKNIDFIICDHHLPDEKLPDALAILNPKQPDCKYPFKELPGCGIGFKLCQAITQNKKLSFSMVEPYLDLVAVAISADIVPIFDENRVLTCFGLQKLKQRPNLGLKALLVDVFNKPQFEVSDLVFSIGPRINAAGRIAHGKEAVELMIASTDEKANEIAHSIRQRNDTRRGIDQTMTREAICLLQQENNYPNNWSTVLYKSDWHKGVVGIVASRIIENLYRPTIILCEANGKATGSARSIEGFDLYSALESCSDLLEQFGGHTHAAGMTLPVENVPLLKSRFEQEVKKRINEDKLIETIRYEMEIKLDRINPSFINTLQRIAPYGPTNPNPVFRTNNVWSPAEYVRIMGDNHLQLFIKQDDKVRGIRAVAFNLRSHYDKIESGQSFDICYTIEQNYFDKKASLQLNIKDIKFKN